MAVGCAARISGNSAVRGKNGSAAAFTDHIRERR
jgi:hypothetical protein